VAVLLGVAFLGEAMTGWTLAGGVCILVGVALVLDLSARPAPSDARL
jgi:drug/metabolite transporter (DMT)-like permease